MRIKNKIVLFCLLGAMLLTAGIAYGQDEDREGSKDHPLISRYLGSIIIYYEIREFDEYVLPLAGKLEEGKLSKSQDLEGKVTRITYKAPEGRSTLEIYRNYELSLKRAGFEVLFSCAKEGCGEGNYYWPDLFCDLNPLFEGGAKDMLRGEDRYQRYLSAKLSRPEGDVYVSLYVSLGHRSYPAVQLDVIEVKPMETGLVVINTEEALAGAIAKAGHIAIYGIYFDTDKAEVKPESKPVLEKIVKLLQQNPNLKLYVVGHTDNVGDLTYNMELSQARADAVVKMLISKYNADAKQLKAYGVGPLLPVASNKTEEGRAKNRRVELVEQ